MVGIEEEAQREHGIQTDAERIAELEAALDVELKHAAEQERAIARKDALGKDLCAIINGGTVLGAEGRAKAEGWL